MTGLGRVLLGSVVASMLCCTAAALLPSSMLGGDVKSPPESSQTAAAKKAADFLLPATTGKQVALHDFAEKSVVVVYFLGLDCPIANLYLKDLAELQKRYESQGVQVIGIHSNRGATP